MRVGFAGNSIHRFILGSKFKFIYIDFELAGKMMHSLSHNAQIHLISRNSTQSYGSRRPRVSASGVILLLNSFLLLVC